MSEKVCDIERCNRLIEAARSLSVASDKIFIGRFGQGLYRSLRARSLPAASGKKMIHPKIEDLHNFEEGMLAISVLA